jgi:hypothetical protein
MSDPIFAVIETYRAAWAALEKDCSRLDDESTPEAEAEFDRLNDAVEEAAGTLADTQPTTMAGAVALSIPEPSPVGRMVRAISSLPGL